MTVSDDEIWFARPTTSARFLLALNLSDGQTPHLGFEKSPEVMFEETKLKLFLF